ncbi:uncharacterized protein BDCG_00522 [Blastomyces dermatitidis ER-3]|uniref:Uncharacterized protein n=1 Tax=Ajellomyces dermatitidis (strain ER-3 / ATCC MYA-2586) TaxID=559297 RepID=A0ABP2EKL2_AJEDR|nr:uncharacterized protein BDCG_00522 [Blastomyces dermatitidis ER-3]EEQ83717.2 hypothetical protein BDCG_00522 [Blastomyces dermatitidis ER-3]
MVSHTQTKGDVDIPNQKSPSTDPSEAPVSKAQEPKTSPSAPTSIPTAVPMGIDSSDSNANNADPAPPASISTSISTHPAPMVYAPGSLSQSTTQTAPIPPIAPQQQLPSQTPKPHLYPEPGQEREAERDQG